MEHKGIEKKDFIKIIFPLNKDESYVSDTETMWAKKTGNEKLFILKNVPFYKKGVSYNDIVSVIIDKGNIIFKKCVQSSGHSTYRIFLNQDTSLENISIWGDLEKLGCSFERATDHLYSIDMYPKVNVKKAYILLEQGESKGFWEFEEGKYANLKD